MILTQTSTEQHRRRSGRNEIRRPAGASQYTLLATLHEDAACTQKGYVKMTKGISETDQALSTGKKRDVLLS